VPENPRTEALLKMAAAHPDDPRPRFGLALEYEKAADWAATARELRAYLALADDEGNAYGRLGHALRQLGHHEEAREAYRQGIAAAERHGHPTMSMEFEETLDSWN
jgi:Flp pilus assembly protein TadD